MKTRHVPLLSILADGELHSGETLAHQLNISRAAIWKSIKRLESFGLNINAERGKGYQLNRPIDLLSVNKIESLLPPEVSQVIRNIEVLFKTDSTNNFLFNRLNNNDIHGDIIFAEYQSHGRGRRGNQWNSPLASGLMFSVGWRFENIPEASGLLSLFIGVAIARTLQSIKINNVGLKWPNDVVVQDKKIAGILIEVRGEASGPMDVVIGIGLNYELPEQFDLLIEQPITDIRKHTNENLSRNKLAATLITNVFDILKKLEVNNCTELLEEWRALDCFIDRQAKLVMNNKEIKGVVKGVDEQGFLLMSVSGNIKRFNSGEISLRGAS